MRPEDQTTYHRLLSEDDDLGDNASNGLHSRWMKSLFHASSWALALGIFALAVAITISNLSMTQSQCITQSSVWCKLIDPVLRSSGKEYA